MDSYKWRVCPVQGRQLKDVREEDVFGDFRFCDTYRGGGGYDQFPSIAKARGLSCAGDVGLQFVVQLYGCALACPYCYVTNDGIYGKIHEYTSERLLGAYGRAFIARQPGVFHLMGGAPAIYHRHWPELLDVIPEDVIFHSDLMLVEGVYDLPKLSHCNANNALYAVNIKGVSAEDHFRNTGKKLDDKQFWYNFYCVVDSGIDFYLTFTNPDKDHLDEFKERIVSRYGDWVLDDHFVIDLIDYDALQSEEEDMSNFYIRATGNNRFMGGGTYNWLRIRDITKDKHGYEIKVKVSGNMSYIVADKHPKYLEFAKGWPGLMPVSFGRVLHEFK